MSSGPQRLRAYLERSKQNQRQFAALTRFSEPFISQLVTGTRKPSIDNAVKLEQLTGIPVACWSEHEASELVTAGGSRRQRR